MLARTLEAMHPTKIQLRVGGEACKLYEPSLDGLNGGDVGKSWRLWNSMSNLIHLKHVWNLVLHVEMHTYYERMQREET